LLTGKNANRKLLSKDIVCSSEAQGSIHSSRSSGDKLVRPVTLLNVPKPAFTPSQHLTLDLLTEVPLAVTRQEIGHDIGVDMCSGHNQESLADQVKRERLVSEHKTAEAPMPVTIGANVQHSFLWHRATKSLTSQVTDVALLATETFAEMRRSLIFFGGHHVNAYSSRTRKRRYLDIELNTEKAKTSMDARASEVVIGLLARWAVRAARNGTVGQRLVALAGVTADVSKS
jgi:hypothetical protein